VFFAYIFSPFWDHPQNRGLRKSCRNRLDFGQNGSKTVPKKGQKTCFSGKTGWSRAVRPTPLVRGCYFLALPETEKGVKNRLFRTRQKVRGPGLRGRKTSNETVPKHPPRTGRRPSPGPKPRYTFRGAYRKMGTRGGTPFVTLPPDVFGFLPTPPGMAESKTGLNAIET